MNLSLHEVPWDQALDIILRDPMARLRSGRNSRAHRAGDASRRRRKIARTAGSGREQRAADLPPHQDAELRESGGPGAAARRAPRLSNRGDVQIDPRTNTLIIRDIAAKLQGVAQVLDTLDRPQPQVEIEARIIQTTRDFARNLGVQWGFNGRVSPDLGNTTGLAFPNQGGITGRTGGVQGPIQGELTDHTATAVNLGVPRPTSAIGLALGSVNGAVNLDVALSALESSGHGRILSTPRIATQNNVAGRRSSRACRFPFRRWRTTR